MVLIVFLHRVPFVDGNDARLALLVGEARHLRILLGKALCGVDHDDTHLGALHGRQTAQHAVPLHAVLHFAAFAQAGSVDKRKFAVPVVHITVHRVPGGARLVGDDHAFLAQDMVDQAGLAYVGAADDRHTDALVLILSIFIFRQAGAHRFQQVARAVAVHRGNRIRFADAQRIKSYSSMGGSPTPSTLFTTRNTGLPLRMSMAAMS